MATNPNSAGAAGALDKIATGLASGMQGREQAQLEKQTATLKMKQQKRSDDTGAWQVAMDKLTAENKKVVGEIQREKTFRALKAYSADGNVRHLNGTVLDEARPAGIIRFNKLSPSIDSALIAQAGLDPEDIFTTGVYDDGTDSTDSKQYVKATMQDGTEKLLSTYDFKKATGYFKNLTDEETAQELAANEAKKKTNDYDLDDPQGLKTGGEWGKKAWVAQKTGVSDPKNTISSLKRDMEVGNTGGKLDQAVATEQSLDQQFNGSFTANFDPSNDEQSAQVESSIEAIEAYRGISWSASELSDINDMAMLISLGNPAAELTDDETGLWDNMLFKTKKYFTDNGGSGANEAYAAYRNSLRNALFGSALTEHEIAAFNEQLGTLSMQRGPLLQQMITSMTQVQSKFDAMYKMNNSYVATYRMGLNRKKLANIIGALGKNIQTIKDLEAGKITRSPEDQEAFDKEALDGIF